MQQPYAAADDDDGMVIDLDVEQQEVILRSHSPDARSGGKSKSPNLKKGKGKSGKLKKTMTPTPTKAGGCTSRRSQLTHSLAS
jgi:hypothetical protein